MQNRVREIREKLGLSRRALSKKAGIDYNVLFLLERGEFPFYPKYRRLLSEALGVSEEELLVKDEEKSEVKT